VLPCLDLASLSRLSCVSSQFNSLVTSYMREATHLPLTSKLRKSLKKHHLENIAKSTGSLRVLNLSGCLDGLTNEILCMLLLENSDVTTLDISGCNKITKKAFADLFERSSAQEVPRLLRLEHLLLDDCKSINGELGRFLVHMNIKTISLAGIWTIDDKAVEEFVTFFPALENINLSRCYKVTDTAMNHISHCTNLRILKISGCWRVSDRGLDLIMSRCPYLSAMVIDDCRSISRRMMTVLEERGILVLEAAFTISASLKYKKDGRGDNVRADIEAKYQTISSSIRNGFQAVCDEEKLRKSRWDKWVKDM